MVGVNAFVQENETRRLRFSKSTRSAGETQLAKLEVLRKTRDHDAVRRSLERLGAAARTTENLMPRILDAVRTYATVARCATRSARYGASTRKCRSYSYALRQAQDERLSLV
jgi:methylmalonyl-CoA mutase N-terminal domain/subunit